MQNLTDAFVQSAGKHFVSLSCVQSVDGKEIAHIFSGYVVCILDTWFLVTAGHILRDIKMATDAGATFDVWRLDDQTAGKTEIAIPIPYEFNIEEWLVLEDESIGLDYAVVPLSEYYTNLLEKGGAEPIYEDSWGDYIQDHDYWALLGIPSESVEYDQTTQITARFAVLPLEQTDAPEGLESVNKFYAKISEMGNISDIDGMSGGPIFSLKKVDGDWRYHIIGVQSGWFRQIKVITACPIKSLLTEIENTVMRQSNNQTN